MLNINVKQQEKVWPICPAYTGAAIIVDATELKTYETEYGQKQKFRLLIELDIKDEKGQNWIVSTSPMTPSANEKSALTKFCKSIGVDTSVKDFELEQLQDKPIHVIVEHQEYNGKTYANVAYTGKVKKSDVAFQKMYKPRVKGAPISSPVVNNTPPATSAKEIPDSKPIESEDFDNLFNEVK